MECNQGEEGWSVIKERKDGLLSRRGRVKRNQGDWRGRV